MALPSLNERVEDVKKAVESADPALSREELIALGVSEKAGANRKTLLKYLREKAKGIPVEVGLEVAAKVPPHVIIGPPTADADTKITVEESPMPVDAPGEPPPGYVPTAEEPPSVPPGSASAIIFTAPADLAPKPLMQEIDPRPCDFPFRAMDINRYPVCVIHNSGLCLPCSHQEPPVMRCRAICFAVSDKHHNVKQPTVVMKDRVIENPATVEELSVSEFDG